MTTLTQLVISHHIQARHKAHKTLRCRRCTEFNDIAELKRVGSKFTTRVEKRLRKLESGK